MKSVTYLFIAAAVLTGCTIPQQADMGASPDRNEAFNGYGVNHVRGLEGPLSDLMVPDQSPKGLTDPVLHSTGEGSHVTRQRNLSMKHEGVNHQGPRILSNRPGVLRDKYSYSNDPNVGRLDKGQQAQQATTELTKEIEKRVESLQNVRDAHVMTDGDQIVIGIESSEQDRVKLKRVVEEEVQQVTDIRRVHITTDRKLINRMNALEHHVGMDKPFDSIGGAVGDLADLVDDAAHRRR
ncbi:YhcN/YlaJ family sporulation lipoprotein [Alkalihalobacillus sp. MEB130]|uniref:YhcN/YlaJ family sporulation lipoprotein n=1 Tax=Alkalihalobacillus sp. MEB130 TaxID=2976704 RepID=UPI0028DECB18|nr:YhcN/YlaJ family sporulation lipoprotein [Alkalihalobacillus sp. MEB130]MDT8859924.1 YhcN/YlaJ family sporulation lipoprotein [Alkalihalobacillus sp. MEB130]